ncbi:hypothetical protein N7G274_007575 [Stereocaulon virgatum]|uniref:M protein, serotype 2.1 n=1 Tax=Stereocaulon virgatum TaxID=373712 RepID=A0ABR4A328_9LECA
MSNLNKKPPPDGAKTRSPAVPTSRNSPSKTSPNMNGVGRSPSLRGGAGLSRPGRSGGNRPATQTSFLNTNALASEDADEEEARAEHMSLMEELKSRVQKAETASEEYQRQLNLLQARLEESQHEQSQLEDRLHQSNERIEELENDQVQAKRQKREMEDLFETERKSMIQHQAEQKATLEGLQAANQRLKETLAQRETRNSLDGENVRSRTSSAANETDQFAPPSSLQRSDSKENSKLVMQKDRVIESLRLELAEAQIKIMEMDSMGGSHVHELEKKLLEVKITNARLMEDNESFQLLLSEKTLNGDFTKTDAMQQSSGLGSLAEELGSEELEESSEGKSDDTRRIEAEAKSLKDQNKALALYIENIIGRLLQHKEFENILDKTPDLMSGAASKPPDTNKDLPPPPPPKDEEQPTGFLQRARSVVAGQAKRPRPTSQIQAAPTPSSTPNEDPSKASSIPLGRSQSTRGRGHQRSQSEMLNAAPLVNQMYRGPPSTGSGGPLMSPGISPGVTTATRPSFSPSPAATATSNATSRAPSGSQFSNTGERNPGSSSDSTFSDHSGGVDSPPRTSAGQTNYTGAVMTQNKLRPLRLVQENSVKEEDPAVVAARKKANRGSWIPSMSWMGTQRTASSENNPS